MALFPKGTNPKQLVTAIIDAGLGIVSFRDLSQAIEMLLLMPRFRTSRPAATISGTTNRGKS